MKRVGRPGRVRFLTFSCYERLPLFGNPIIRNALADELLRLARQFEVRLISWVIMPEHVHVLCVPPGTKQLSRWLWQLKRDFGKNIIARWKQLQARVLPRITDSAGKPHFCMPGGGYDRVIRRDIKIVTDYIHENPVRRGLVKTASEWKWSSLGWPLAFRTTAPLEQR